MLIIQDVIVIIEQLIIIAQDLLIYRVSSENFRIIVQEVVVFVVRVFDKPGAESITRTRWNRLCKRPESG